MELRETLGQGIIQGTTNTYIITIMLHVLKERQDVMTEKLEVADLSSA